MKNILAYSTELNLVESFVATYHIYVLKNPITNEIFYVGKTVKELNSRLSGHISDSGNGTEKGTIIQQILESGNKPVIEAIETMNGICYIDKVKWSQREYFWINHYKQKGCNLTNIAGMKEDAANREYQGYLNALKTKESYWHYYYCGKTKYGIKVYDEEKLNEDGFYFDNNEIDMTPEQVYHPYIPPSEITYAQVYDDENPDYIRSSQEEI